MPAHTAAVAALLSPSPRGRHSLPFRKVTLTKVLGSTFLGKPTVQKLRGNFSENTPEAILVWGQDGMDASPAEGAWEGGMTGVENSLAAMQQSITQLTQAIGQTLTPQGKGQGKGSAKGQGKGNAKPPGARKAENLKPHSERASPTVEEVCCIKCKAYNWTSRCVCRSCGTALPQGNRTATPPPSSGPATVKSGGASSSSVASSGLSYATVAKGAPGQADPKTDDKAVKTQKADKLEALACNTRSQRPSPRGLATPAGPAQKRSPRSTPAWCPVRFGGCKEAQSGSQSGEMRRSTPPGGRIFATCKRRECSCRLRVESCKGGGLPHPSTASTPPGGCRLDLVIRRHGRPDKHVAAVRPSCCGGARHRRRERRGRETTQGRPLCQCHQNSQGDCSIGRPRPHQQACSKCHLPSKMPAPS